MSGHGLLDLPISAPAAVRTSDTSCVPAARAGARPSLAGLYFTPVRWPTPWIGRILRRIIHTAMSTPNHLAGRQWRPRSAYVHQQDSRRPSCLGTCPGHFRHCPPRASSKGRCRCGRLWWKFATSTMAATDCPRRASTTEGSSSFVPIPGWAAASHSSSAGVSARNFAWAVVFGFC
jgi:hypothetical protein